MLRVCERERKGDLVHEKERQRERESCIEHEMF